MLSDFELELERTEGDIARFESGSGDLDKRTSYLFRLYHRATLCGDPAAFDRAEAEIDKTILRFGPQEDLCFLKAHLDFQLHRLDAVKRDLAMAPALAGRFEGRALQAEVDFQEGRYGQAKSEYERLIEENPTWDNLARLAHFKSKMGEMEEADELYFDAEDQLTAKEMRSFAWIELQRGVLDLSRGHYEHAAGHYDRARRAYSGYWVVDEHIAELLAARGKFSEALALYQSLVARVPKPELRQALGELYLFLGKPAQADPWLNVALAGYLDFARRSDARYGHHLSHFFSDVREDAKEALSWARKDIALRENFSTQAALAWALYRDNQVEAAVDTINQALASGVRDSGIFAQASTIFQAAGSTCESHQCLAMAVAINPYFRNFHIHR
jgi:tetratricopeptide (TPR) repeat protein